MKNQALFSSKNKVKTIKCRLLQFLFGALRVNLCIYNAVSNCFILLKVISIRPSRFLTIVSCPTKIDTCLREIGFHNQSYKV